MPEGERAVAYVRVSVVGDRAARGRFESPELQRQAIDAWAAQHGVTIVDEIQDLNRSGGTLTRPGLERALARLAEGDANGIVVARSDRASRRAADGLNLIERLARAGQWIAAADGTIDTTTRAGRMATTMHFAMAQSELERFKEQSAIIHEKAIVEKGRQMGPTPFGYRRGPDGRLIVDPKEAAVVVSIFQRRADGAGWVRIAGELDRQAVRQRNGRRLNSNMLRRLIARRVYVGEANHGRHVRSGAHPAIVSEALWAAANRAAPIVRSEPRQPRVHADSLLRGLLRCAGCRYVLKRMPGRVGEGPRWRCRTLAPERTATHDCAEPARLSSFEGQVVEAIVLGQFLRLATGQEFEPAATVDLAALDREQADADALLDELSSLEVRRRLGPERWGRLAQEARAASDDVQRRRTAALAQVRMARVTDRQTLEEFMRGAPLPDVQEALCGIVQAVMVGAGEGLVADRVWVVPLWDTIDLPRRGASDFVARRWRPGVD